MKEVSKTGIRHLREEDGGITSDPYDKLGYTQERFLAFALPYIPLDKGVYRFKTHKEMNAQWDVVEKEIVRLQQERQIIHRKRHNHE